MIDDLPPENLPDVTALMAERHIPDVIPTSRERRLLVDISRGRVYRTPAGVTLVRDNDGVGASRRADLGMLRKMVANGWAVQADSGAWGLTDDGRAILFA